MTAWLTQDIGDMVYIIEDKTEVDEYAYIVGIAFSISPGGIVKFSWILLGMLCLSLGLSPIAVEFDPLSTDGIDFGYLPQVSKNAASTRSFSTWIYIHTNTPGVTSIILAPFSDAAGTTVGITDNWQIAYYQKGAAGPGTWTTPNNSIVANTWTHVLCTRDGSNAANAPIIYIGGIVQALTNTTVQNGATVSEEGAHFFIGNIHTGTINWIWPVDGVIKDVRAFDVISTQAEATSLAAGGDVTRGLVFQAPCVRTEDLADFEDLTLTSSDKMIDNMYGMVGTPNGSVITRLIP